MIMRERASGYVLHRYLPGRFPEREKKKIEKREDDVCSAEISMLSAAGAGVFFCREETCRRPDATVIDRWLLMFSFPRADPSFFFFSPPFFCSRAKEREVKSFAAPANEVFPTPEKQCFAFWLNQARLCCIYN